MCCHEIIKRTTLFTSIASTVVGVGGWGGQNVVKYRVPNETLSGYGRLLSVR